LVYRRTTAVADSCLNLLDPRKEKLMRTIIPRLRRRLQDESGFTLIELLIVLVIIGILLAIAVPSYLGFKDRANNTAASANVRSGIPAVETFFADHDTYVGMDVAALQTIVAGVKITGIGTLTASSYCVSANVGGKVWNKNGPAANIVAGGCP
jgi:prepilin-type N-terminal cleavage/methylation domain-containing protein